MTVQNIHSIYTVVKDMDVMQNFYSEVFGLKPKFRDKNEWTQFSLSNTNFALSSKNEAAQGAQGSIAVFEVLDSETNKLRLSIENAGGTFLSQRDMGSHGKVLSFSDPEGNHFQIFSKSHIIS